MKRPYLVSGDYGVFWAYIWAESREAVETWAETEFEAQVHDEPPDWLFDLRRRLESFDIEEPPEWMPLK